MWELFLRPVSESLLNMLHSDMGRVVSESGFTEMSHEVLPCTNGKIGVLNVSKSGSSTARTACIQQVNS